MRTVGTGAALARAATIRRWARAAAIMCAAVLVVDTYFAVAKPYLFFDLPLEVAVQGVDWGPLLRLFDFYTWLGGYYQFFAALALIGLVFAANRPAVWLMAVGALSGAWYSVMNALIHRARPSDHLVHVSGHLPGFGYPSGHAAFYASFSVLLVVCLGLRYLRGGALLPAWAAAAFITATAGLSRVYVGQHWPSDVVAGLAIGLGWAALAISIPRLSDPVLRRER